MKGCLTDPSLPLTFTFEGRPIKAVHGQSIGAALYAAGVRVFSRSFKYHRPRGLFCVSGDCPNCLMRVDGRPNVRTCVEPAREGQKVTGQNAWPSLNFDVLRIFDKLDALLPVGFYYKSFHKPRWLWPIFEHVVRHIAGLGHVDLKAVPDLDKECEHLHAEVCVIGGGASGIAAANAAAEAGADVLLLERMPMLGGRMLTEAIPALSEPPDFKGERRRTMLGTTAFGLYEGNVIGAFHCKGLLKIRAQQIIVCTGSRQMPMPFHNNDLPGIMSLDGVLRLGRLYGVKAGKRAVVVGAMEGTEGVLAQLEALGIEFGGGLGIPEPVDGQNWLTIQALGGNKVTGVRLIRREKDGAIDAFPKGEYACDLLCVASERVPANELLLQGGMRFHYEYGRWKPTNTVPGLLAAGGAAGMLDRESRIISGRVKGWEAAAALGYSVPQPTPPIYPGSAFAAASGTLDKLRLGKDASTDAQLGKRFVCFCEDVTVKDIDRAVAEGFDAIEPLKRYSTVNMGPCQGKMCGPTAVALCAAPPAATSTTSAARRAGRRWCPSSWRSSRRIGAIIRCAGRRCTTGTRRTGLAGSTPGSGSGPTATATRAPRCAPCGTGVGLIDVSTLGKIEVIGPDAAELLGRIYLNEWAKLPVGGVRYGVMCTEEGIVFDDGVGARLGPEHFFLTATTGNAEAVFQWLELWRTTWRLNALVLNQTSAFAAMNLAGPRSRDVLARLTKLDLSATAFPYPALRQAKVAEVSCRILRLGFVGELGYELHCPTAHAWHLWEALLAAGAEAGIKPFGVEAQRILRLEKAHLIVGQDTDALSNPLGAGLGALVKFRKPQFHGRDALLRFKEMEARSRLVGFQLPERPKNDNVWARQLEGCQVVEQGRPVGRVTSARYSPTLEKYIGLAWVPEARSAAGQSFAVRCNGVDQPAQVVPVPFYDPEGQRLKS